MCDQDPRCRTQHHRPGTICPYSKRTSRSSSYVPSEPTTFTAPSVKTGTPAPAGGPTRLDDRSPRTSSAICAALFLAMWLLATAKTGGIVTLPLILVGGVLVAIPAAIASGLMYHCHAWLNNGMRRCRKPRKGFMMRCRHHEGQIVIAYDLAALLASAIAVANAILALRILRHASEFDFTPITLVT